MAAAADRRQAGSAPGGTQSAGDIRGREGAVDTTADRQSPADLAVPADVEVCTGLKRGAVLNVAGREARDVKSRERRTRPRGPIAAKEIARSSGCIYPGAAVRRGERARNIRGRDTETSVYRPAHIQSSRNPHCVRGTPQHNRVAIADGRPRPYGRRKTKVPGADVRAGADQRVRKTGRVQAAGSLAKE